MDVERAVGRLGEADAPRTRLRPAVKREDARRHDANLVHVFRCRKRAIVPHVQPTAENDVPRMLDVRKTPVGRGRNRQVVAAHVERRLRPDAAPAPVAAEGRVIRENQLVEQEILALTRHDDRALSVAARAGDRDRAPRPSGSAPPRARPKASPRPSDVVSVSCLLFPFVVLR